MVNLTRYNMISKAKHIIITDNLINRTCGNDGVWGELNYFPCLTPHGRETIIEDVSEV